MRTIPRDSGGVGHVSTASEKGGRGCLLPFVIGGTELREVCTNFRIYNKEGVVHPGVFLRMRAEGQDVYALGPASDCLANTVRVPWQGFSVRGGKHALPRGSARAGPLQHGLRCHAPTARVATEAIDLSGSTDFNCRTFRPDGFDRHPCGFAFFLRYLFSQRHSGSKKSQGSESYLRVERAILMGLENSALRYYGTRLSHDDAIPKGIDVSFE